MFYAFLVSLVYFVLMPILGVVLYGFFPMVKIDVFLDMVRRSMVYLKNSMLVSVSVTILSVVIGTTAAISLWRFEFVGRRTLRKLILLPLINPPFVGSVAFIMLFGRRGLITHELLGLSISPFGYHGIIVMQCLSLSTIAYLIISSSIVKIDPLLEDAARNLRASEKSILWHITLPIMMPEISTAAIMVFLSSMADFGTPLIIGGKFQTLASDLYIQITGLYDMKSASISGILLLIPCIGLFLLQKFYISRKQYFSRSISSNDIVYKYVEKTAKWSYISITFIYVTVIITKFVFIIIGAFTKQWGYDYSFTLTHVSQIMKYDLTPFLNSVKLALVVALISSFLGVFLSYIIKRKNIKYKKMIDFMGTLPAAVPGILFGIGYLVTFKYPIFGVGRLWLKDFKPVILLGTGSIIYLICIYRYLNVGLRIGYALIEHINPNIEDAARNLGASESKVFSHMTLPLMMPALSAAFVKNYSATMTTLGAIIFLLLPSNKVAVQQIFQMITSSATGVGAAMALLLSGTTVVVMIIMKFIYSKLMRIK